MLLLYHLPFALFVGLAMVIALLTWKQRRYVICAGLTLAAAFVFVAWAPYGIGLRPSEKELIRSFERRSGFTLPWDACYVQSSRSLSDMSGDWSGLLMFKVPPERLTQLKSVAAKHWPQGTRFRRSEEEVNLRWVMAPGESLVLQTHLHGWGRTLVIDVKGRQVYYLEQRS